jgi:hypothetical protein
LQGLLCGGKIGIAGETPRAHQQISPLSGGSVAGSASGGASGGGGGGGGGGGEEVSSLRTSESSARKEGCWRASEVSIVVRDATAARSSLRSRAQEKGGWWRASEVSTPLPHGLLCAHERK